MVCLCQLLGLAGERLDLGYQPIRGLEQFLQRAIDPVLRRAQPTNWRSAGPISPTGST